MRITLALVASLLAVACSGSATSSPLDGGGDGSCGAPPPTHCAAGCGGGTVSAQCIDGAWQCPVFSGACAGDASFPLDSGNGDAAPKSDAGIECSGSICNAATEYCDIRGGGAQLPDAGSNFSAGCLPLPAMPCDAGTGCACIPNTCNCTDDGGAITNECLYP